MFRLYLRFSASLVIAFMLFSYLLSVLSSLQPLHPALRGFVEGCEGISQPCWYGIVLGQTTYMEANTILNNLGFKASLPLTHTNTYQIAIEGCPFEARLSIEKITVDILGITSCGGMTAEDALAILDMYPESIAGNCIGEIMLVQSPRSIIMNEIALDSEVDRVTLINPAYRYLEGFGVPWQGFRQYETLGDPGCG
jgi:hypothetical protein